MQAAPVDAGWDATPWGAFTNFVTGIWDPKTQLTAVKGVAQGTARFAAEAALSLQQAVGSVVDKTAGKTDATDLEPVPTEGLQWMLGQEPLQGWAPQVADMELSIKDNAFAKKTGWDKFALPLAFGTIVGENALNFVGGEGEAPEFKAAVDYLVKENDAGKVAAFLIHNGIEESVAHEAAPFLANTVDPTQVGNTLKTVEAVQSVVDRTSASKDKHDNDQLVSAIAQTKDGVRNPRSLDIYSLLADRGVSHEVASTASNDLKNITDENQIRAYLAAHQLLSGPDVAALKSQAAGVQRLPFDTVADRAPTPVDTSPLRDVPEPSTDAVPPERPTSVQDAKDRFMSEVVQPKIDAGEPIVIGSDEMKDHFGKDYTPAAHEALYSPATRDLYKELVSKVNNDTVRITFGGPGSGKTDFALARAAHDFDGVIYDSTLSDFKTAVEKIRIAHQAGKKVELFGILPDVEKARYFSLKREGESGRGVPHDYFVKAHVGSPETVARLMEEGHVDPADVHLFDTRGISSKEDILQMIAGDTLDADPLATLRKAGYNESYVRQQTISGENLHHDQGGFRSAYVSPHGKVGKDQGFTHNDGLGSAGLLPRRDQQVGINTNTQKIYDSTQPSNRKEIKQTDGAPGAGAVDRQTMGGPRGQINGAGHPEPALLGRGSSAGTSTQISAEARAAQEAAIRESGQKKINDQVPMPDSVGDIIARNGHAIPIERTAASALDRLSKGPDAGSWQSLVKGYMYNWSPTKFASGLDYLGTPEFVLEKVGLGKGAEMLQDAKDQAAATIKREFDTIGSWIDRVKNQSQDGKVHTHSDTSTLIFDWLDGHEREVTPYMSDAEIAVAREIRDYLKTWAGRLHLPEENQIGKYITHIFERSVESKGDNQFRDPELASIMAQNVAKSVYDPFLQKRLGGQDYVHDVWRALDAYVKRASRKEAMDPALAQLAEDAKHLDQHTYNYVKNLSHRVNLRPTELETAFDTFITQTPIGHYFTDRPTAYLSKKVRQMFYRGTLGLNFSSGLRNLTQGANTYAKLGEKYTVIGYAKLFSRMAARDLSELHDNNVLSDQLIGDRQTSAIKRTMQAVDSTLFAHYTLTEAINRGSVYFGAKAKALAEGLSEEQAIKYGKRMVRETQFSFGAVDTPVWLNDDVVKTLTQLQTYNVKQTEMLGRMLHQKDFAGLIRFSAASFAMLYTIGRLFGMTASQIVPSIGLGGSPVVSSALAAAGLGSSNSQTHAAAVSQLQRNFFSLIPAGAQIRKTLQGAHDLSRGGDFTTAGKFRYRVGPEDTARALLMGPGSLPQAQKYHNSLGKKKAPTGNPFQ